MANRIGVHQTNEMETGSEEINLSAAKFVRVGTVSLDKYTSIGRDLKIKSLGMAKSTSDTLVFFANVVREFYNCNECAYVEENERAYVEEVDTSGKDGCPRSIFSFRDNQEIRSIAALSKEKVLFATSDHQKILFNQKLIKEMTICDCYDIAFVLNKLVFVFKDGLEIWDISGIAGPVQTINLPNITPPSSSKVCTAIEHGRGVIYVLSQPSFGSNLVTKLSLKGEVIYAYNNLFFNNAGDICASGDGHVFVSFPEEGCIRLLVPDMSSVVEVIENLCKPMSVCFCQESRRLFVYQENNGYLDVFKVQ